MFCCSVEKLNRYTVCTYILICLIYYYKDAVSHIWKLIDTKYCFSNKRCIVNVTLE